VNTEKFWAMNIFVNYLKMKLLCVFNMPVRGRSPAAQRSGANGLTGRTHGHGWPSRSAAEQDAGLYTSTSEVVCEALRLMDDKDRLLNIKLQQLGEDIMKGLESGPAAPWDPEEIKRDGRARKSRLHSLS